MVMSFSEAGKLGSKKRKEYAEQRYLKNPIKCKYCSTELCYEKRNQKFCNHSCFAKFSNSRRGKKVPREQTCVNCNMVFCDRKKIQKYCSKKCQQTYQRLMSVKNKTASISSIKKYLVGLNNSCSICGLPNTWNNKKIVMVLDHIDGNSSNNDLSNLRLVCPNCDSQLDTYKSKNIGNGRFSRKKRYKDGKSY